MVEWRKIKNLMEKRGIIQEGSNKTAAFAGEMLSFPFFDSVSRGTENGVARKGRK